MTGQSPYGCNNTASRTITVVPPPSIVPTNYSPLGVCANTPVSLKAVITRPDNLADTYTIQWDPAVGLNPLDANKDSIVVIPTVTTRYRYRVTGLAQFNCTDTASVLVKVLPQPVVSATTNVQFVCAGSPATLSVNAISPPGIADTYTYQWTGAGLNSNTGATVTATPTVDTRYRVRAIGQAQYGCSDTTSVLVRIAPDAIAEFSVVDSLDASGRRTSKPPVFFTFNNTSRIPTPNPGNFTFSGFSWTYQRVRDVTGASTGDQEEEFSTKQTPDPLQLTASGYYIITLETSALVNGQPCTQALFQRTVYVPDPTVPNIITPNGDGKNDVFKICSAC